MTMKPVLAIATVALLAVSCSDDSSPHPDPDPMPTGEPTADELVDFTGLALPDDVQDLEIERSRNESGGLVYTATFSTSAKGADLFCELGDNFSSYDLSSPPDGEGWLAEEFPEETVDGYTECTGANLERDAVNRRAFISYPDEDSADVLLEAEHLNTR